MYRRLHQVRLGAITWFLRSPTFTGKTRHSLFPKRLKNGLLIRRIFISRDQSRRLELQASCRILYQPFCVRLRPFSIDDFKDKFVFGIQGNGIPVVAATSVSRIAFVAMFFLLEYEVPLFVELNLLGVGGKTPRVRRGVVRHACQQAGCAGSPFGDERWSSGLSFACHCLRRRVREWKRWFRRGGWN